MSTLRDVSLQRCWRLSASLPACCTPAWGQLSLPRGPACFSHPPASAQPTAHAVQHGGATGHVSESSALYPRGPREAFVRTSGGLLRRRAPRGLGTRWPERRLPAGRQRDDGKIVLKVGFVFLLILF